MKELFNEVIKSNELISATLGKPRKKSLPYKKVIIRPFIKNEQYTYQAELHYDKKVIHNNFTPVEIVDYFSDLMTLDFKQANIFTVKEDIQILATKPENAKIIRKTATKKQENLNHNREKNHILKDGEPIDFLIKLKVMDENGHVFPKYMNKFKQINKFLEIVGNTYKSLPKGKIKIIDFGCGKAYLTFALYYYLKIQQNRDVDIIGLDLKEDVIVFCNNVAKELEYNELEFKIGDIADYKDTSANMVVTLHACDTATDYALINAVSWNTDVILSVPCCQHELFKQIDNPLNNPILKHGIIKDKFTEILTNGIRGLKLEEAGYEVSMVEFTQIEHTAKNVMIKAIKSKKTNVLKAKKARDEYNEIVSTYNIDPTIKLLKGNVLD